MALSKNMRHLDSISSFLQTGMIRQLIFLIGIAISVAVGIVLYMSVKEPMYRPLDYQVNMQNMASIVDTLDKAGIHYKLNDQENMILVPAKDVQLAKMKLSASGVPRDDGFNYSFLNEQNNIANSQFIENARYIRALENDLSKTIGAIEGVSIARVHIAIPQNNVFADESNKVTASVVLSISPSFMSDKEKVQAIMQIVAGSVPGLDPRDVAITDQYGHFLTAGLDQNAVYNSEQLNYQNKLQNYYEKRIETMIVPMLGENRVTVRVFADIDFTQQEESNEAYDPDKKSVRSEQVMSEQNESSGAAGVPGSLSNTPPTSDSDKSSANQSNGSQGRSQSTKNYELNKSVSYKKSNYAKVKNLSVAVVVDNEMVLDPKTKQYVSKPLNQDKVNKITELVKATIGFDQERGDKVTVINSGFAPVKQAEPVPEAKLWNQLWFWDVTKKIVGIVFGCLFLFIFFKKIVSYVGNVHSVKTRVVREPNGGDEADEEMKSLQEIKEERLSQLKQLATTDPSKVAMVIKNWVGKS